MDATNGLSGYPELRRIIQDAADMYGIRIKDISVDWHLVKSMSGPTKSIINKVVVTTETD